MFEILELNIIISNLSLNILEASVLWLQTPYVFPLNCNLPVHFWSERTLWSRQMKRRIKNCFKTKWSKKKRLPKPSPKVLLIQLRVLLQNSEREKGWLMKQQTEGRCLLETCLSAVLIRYVGGFCPLEEWKELQQSSVWGNVSSWEITHACDWNSFWESRKWCLFSETIRDNLSFPGVGLPAAVNAFLSRIGQFLVNEKWLNKGELHLQSYSASNFVCK